MSNEAAASEAVKKIEEDKAAREQFETRCRDYYCDSGMFGFPECVDDYIKNLKEEWPQFTSEPTICFKYHESICHNDKKMSYYEGLLQRQKDYEKNPPLRLIIAKQELYRKREAAKKVEEARKAAEAAKKVEEEKARKSAEAAKKVEEEARKAAKAAKKVEEEEAKKAAEKAAAEAAKKVEEEKARKAAEKAAEAAKKVEEEEAKKAAEKAAAEVKKVEEEAKAAVSKKRKAAPSKRGREKKKWTMPQTVEEIPLWKKRNKKKDFIAKQLSSDGTYSYWIKEDRLWKEYTNDNDFMQSYLDMW